MKKKKKIDNLRGSLKRVVAIITAWDDPMPGWGEVSQEDRSRLDEVVNDITRYDFLESRAVQDSARELWNLLGDLHETHRSNANLAFWFGTAYDSLLISTRIELRTSNN